jgi:hypothetical protein
MKNKEIKKLETRYSMGNCYQLVVDEETKDHFSIIEFGESCSGILKHWNCKKGFITELKQIIDFLEKFEV